MDEVLGREGAGPRLMLRLESLTKRFDATTAVDGVSLEVRKGELLSLLGPSGCGKTTTLRMIAGFERPTAGRIWLGDRDVAHLPPQRRDVGMVFQSYALFPHLDVYENVAFGLKVRGGSTADLRARVARALERVDLTGYERRAVQALSGGQQQRVALARALAPEPPVLLLDEPLSNLDAALRERTRAEIRDLLKRVGITAIFVTHDQEEAFHLSDRIALLDRGRLQQVGAPEELYHAPANPFVAAFVGRANLLPGRLVSADGEAAVCEVLGSALWPVRVVGRARQGPVRVMVRPEALRLVPGAAGGERRLDGRVLERRFAGAATFFRVEGPGGAELQVSVTGVGEEASGPVAVELAAGATAYAYPEERA